MSTVTVNKSTRVVLHAFSHYLLLEMPKKCRSTRSQGTKLSKYIGGPAELIPSEVPTLRDTLRFVIFQQRFQATHSSLEDLAATTAEHDMLAWMKSNSNFSPPVVISKRAIAKRIKRAYDSCTEYLNSNRKKIYKFHQKTAASSRIEDLDKLFDITKCRCAITACTFDSTICKPGCQVSISDQLPCMCRKGIVPILRKQNFAITGLLPFPGPP